MTPQSRLAPRDKEISATAPHPHFLASPKGEVPSECEAEGLIELRRNIKWEKV